MLATAAQLCAVLTTCSLSSSVMASTNGDGEPKDYSKGLSGARIKERFPHPRDLNVETAMRLHQETLSEIHNIRRHHGASNIKPGGEAALPDWHTLRPSYPTTQPAPRSSQSVLEPTNPLQHLGGANINPIAFGADPTGLKDSTAAFSAAVAALLDTSNRLKRNMSGNIQDLGGATLDLHGGEYVISAPIVVPHYYGNFHITGGTLRASDSFPTDRWLIEVGGPMIEGYPNNRTVNNIYGGSVGEDVNIHHILLDGSHRAQGGIKLDLIIGATVGPAAFIINFHGIGSYVKGGHETMIFESWVAACYWTTTCKDRKSASYGIQFAGFDNYASNVVIFQYADIGIGVYGGGNYLQGVHSWNGGKYAFDVHSWYVHAVGCYVDTGIFHLKLGNGDNSGNEAFTMSDFIFLGASIVANLTQMKPINNVVITNNNFGFGPRGITVEVPKGYNWTALPPYKNTIENNVGNVPSNKITLEQDVKSSSKFVFDFSEWLVFSEAVSATRFDVSVESSTGFPRWILRPATALNAVTVETDIPITDGKVVVTARQGTN